MMNFPEYPTRAEGSTKFDQWVAEIGSDPRSLKVSVEKHFEELTLDVLPRKGILKGYTGPSSHETASQITKEVETILKFLDETEKGVLIVSPGSQSYFEKSIGKTWRDWKDLAEINEETANDKAKKEIDRETANEMAALVEEEMKDASWRRTAKDMKTEALKIKDGIYLVRETFTSVGLMGSEQPFSGKFYLVKTG